MFQQEKCPHCVKGIKYKNKFVFTATKMMIKQPVKIGPCSACDGTGILKDKKK